MKNKKYFIIPILALILSILYGCSGSGEDYSYENRWRPETSAFLFPEWIRQSTPYDCGAASLVMAASYINEFTPDEMDLKKLNLWLDQNIDPYISLEGVSANELVYAAENFYNIPAATFDESFTLKKMYNDIKNGFPMIIGIPSQTDRIDDVMEESPVRHWVLLVGLTSTHIYVSDPWTYEDMGRSRKFTIDSFLERWLKVGIRFFPE